MGKFSKLTAVLAFSLFGCDFGGSNREGKVFLGQEQEAQASSPNIILESSVMKKWQTSCALCHVNGNGGAPKIFDQEDWEARLRKGKEQLWSSTLEGLNNMPPLGYCMACEEEDFSLMIDFMIGGLK